MGWPRGPRNHHPEKQKPENSDTLLNKPQTGLRLVSQAWPRGPVRNATPCIGTGPGHCRSHMGSPGADAYPGPVPARLSPAVPYPPGGGPAQSCPWTPLPCLRLRLQEMALLPVLVQTQPDRGCGRVNTTLQAHPAAKDTSGVCLGQHSPQTWHVAVTGPGAGSHKLSSVPPTRWGHCLPSAHRRALRSEPSPRGHSEHKESRRGSDTLTPVHAGRIFRGVSGPKCSSRKLTRHELYTGL